MGGYRVLARRLFPILVLAACGGGGKKKVKEPVEEAKIEKPKPKPETEEDRAKKRHELATEIVPEGSNCLPPALKEDHAPRLQLGAVGSEARLCAFDTDRERLLGPVACWKVDLSSGGLTYEDPAPLPGRGFDVRLDGRCARGYCLPKDANIGDAKVAHIAWSLDQKKVAVLVADDVHLFDAETKEHQSSFNVRGDRGVTNEPVAIHFVGDTLFVEGLDEGPYSAVWVYKTDGSQVGPITELGGHKKEESPISTFHGSFSLLDKDRVGVAEKGFETLTTYDVANGKRAKLVRKLGKVACKRVELDAYWHDGDKVSDKCKASITKASGHLVGATAVAGSKNFLVLLRGDRLGELGVLDAKTLVEHKSIKLPWCKADDKGDKDESSEKASKADRGDDDGDDDDDDDKGSKPKHKGSKSSKRSGDPDEGDE